MRIKWQNWIWLPVTVIAGVWATTNLRPYSEPIIGYEADSSLCMIVVSSAVIIGIGSFLIFRKKWWWQMFSVFLILTGLAWGMPMPSKSGIRIRLINESDSEIYATISKLKQPNRFAQQKLPPYKETTYRTAPGDYAESLEIKIQSGSNSLETSIIELRHNRVVFSTNGIALQPFSK